MPDQETANLLARYQCQNLFLLVGMNPLPNLVAAQLLAKKDGTLWLLYSYGEDDKETYSTKSFATNLETVLLVKRPDLKIRLENIDSSDNVAIESRLNTILERAGLKNNSNVGLNYTGATKPMAVHSYRILERFCRYPVFSYLDPRDLTLRIDVQGTDPQVKISILKKPHIRESVSLKLDELAALHNYEPATASNPFASLDGNPRLTQLAQRLTELFVGELDFRGWQNWMNDTKLQQLPDISGEFGRITEALNTFCDEPANPDLVAAKLLPKAPPNKRRLRNCAKWFNGGWFEAYVSLIFEKTANAYGMSDAASDLNYRPKGYKDDLQLDAAAIFGYQLYALSITASSKKQRAKEHLLETYVRARQLGGDEARIGLISYYPDPHRLQGELERQWDGEGRIKVFGPDHFPDLQKHFTEWFETANP